MILILAGDEEDTARITRVVREAGVDPEEIKVIWTARVRDVVSHRERLRCLDRVEHAIRAHSCVPTAFLFSRFQDGVFAPQFWNSDPFADTALGVAGCLGLVYPEIPWIVESCPALEKIELRDSALSKSDSALWNRFVRFENAADLSARLESVDLGFSNLFDIVGVRSRIRLNAYLTAVKEPHSHGEAPLLVTLDEESHFAWTTAAQGYYRGFRCLPITTHAMALAFLGESEVWEPAATIEDVALDFPDRPGTPDAWRPEERLSLYPKLDVEHRIFVTGDLAFHHETHPVITKPLSSTVALRDALPHPGSPPLAFEQETHSPRGLLTLLAERMIDRAERQDIGHHRNPRLVRAVLAHDASQLLSSAASTLHAHAIALRESLDIVQAQTFYGANYDDADEIRRRLSILKESDLSQAGRQFCLTRLERAYRESGQIGAQARMQEELNLAALRQPGFAEPILKASEQRSRRSFARSRRYWRTAKEAWATPHADFWLTPAAKSVGWALLGVLVSIPRWPIILGLLGLAGTLLQRPSRIQESAKQFSLLATRSPVWIAFNVAGPVVVLGCLVEVVFCSKPGSLAELFQRHLASIGGLNLPGTKIIGVDIVHTIEVAIGVVVWSLVLAHFTSKILRR